MPDDVPWFNPGRAAREATTPAEKERRAFYTGKRWRRLRALKLAITPLCESCQAEGKVTEADTVHHRQERLARPDLAYSLGNLASSCGPCHTRHHNRTRKR